MRTWASIVFVALTLSEVTQDVHADPQRGSISATGMGSEAPLTSSEVKGAFHEPAVIMAEVKRLKSLGLTNAVQAIVEGTAKMAVGHGIDSNVMSDLADAFVRAMQGYAFLDVSDSQRQENSRYRKVLFVAACTSLSAEARVRADKMSHDSW